MPTRSQSPEPAFGEILRDLAAECPPSAAHQVVGERVKCLELLLLIVHDSRRSENDRGAIIHGMVKRRPGQDQAVDVRDSHTRRNPLFQRAQHATGGRPVNVDRFSDPNVNGRDHERLTIDDKAEMTYQRLVQDPVHDLPIVNAPRGQPLDCRLLGQVRRLFDKRSLFPWHELMSGSRAMSHLMLRSSLQRGNQNLSVLEEQGSIPCTSWKTTDTDSAVKNKRLLLYFVENEPTPILSRKLDLLPSIPVAYY